MFVIGLISLIIWYTVVTVIIGVIVLMLLRLAVSSAGMNPFSWSALTVRRFSDPLVNPVRHGLMRYSLEPKFAPLVTILITILVGWFFLKLVSAVLFTAAGVITSVQDGALLRLIGYLLYGVLAVYSLLIIVRVIFSWGVSYANPVMRFLVRATDPLLVPFRRLIPPLGMIDISPIIVILLLQLFQEAIAGTLIR